MDYSDYRLLQRVIFFLNFPYLLAVSAQFAGSKSYLYTKPTDTRRYLPYKSAHPKHCKVNIPFCLARRICTIVENEQAKLKHLEELKEIMRRQKYPLEIINKGITKAISIPQTELRQPKDTENSEKILPFVTTYNQNNPSVFSTIKTTFQALCDNEVPGMRDFKLIQSRRQPSNLKKILTKAEFTSKPPKVSQCGNTRCECCKSLLLSDHYNVQFCFRIFSQNLRDFESSYLWNRSRY